MFCDRHERIEKKNKHHTEKNPSRKYLPSHVTNEFSKRFSLFSGGDVRKKKRAPKRDILLTDLFACWCSIIYITPGKLARYHSSLHKVSCKTS